MAGNPFDYLNAINSTKEDLFSERDDAEEVYVPFIINKSLSYDVSSLLYANDMNMYPDIPKRLQFDYLRTNVRKGKRYAKWSKPETSDDISVIMEYYGCNKRTATAYSHVTDKAEIARMKSALNRSEAAKK